MNNIENQCCTLEQAKRLKQAGIDQSTTFWVFTAMAGIVAWKDGAFTTIKEQGTEIFFDYRPNIEPMRDAIIASAFSVAELGAMLLKETKDCFYHNPSGCWSHHHTDWDKERGKELFSTQAECYADQVLYLMHAFPVKYTAEFFNNRLKRLNEFKRTE